MIEEARKKNEDSLESLRSEANGKNYPKLAENLIQSFSKVDIKDEKWKIHDSEILDVSSRSKNYILKEKCVSNVKNDIVIEEKSQYGNNEEKINLNYKNLYFDKNNQDYDKLQALEKNNFEFANKHLKIKNDKAFQNYSQGQILNNHTNYQMSTYMLRHTPYFDNTLNADYFGHSVDREDFSNSPYDFNPNSINYFQNVNVGNHTSNNYEIRNQYLKPYSQSFNYARNNKHTNFYDANMLPNHIYHPDANYEKNLINGANNHLNKNMNNLKKYKLESSLTKNNFPSQSHLKAMSNNVLKANFTTKNPNFPHSRDLEENSIKKKELFSSGRTIKRTKKDAINIPLNFVEMSDQELFPLIFNLSREQAGCRFLQKKIEDDNSFVENYLFPAFKEGILEIMVDAFGNYLIQKMLEFSNENILDQVLSVVNVNMLGLGRDPHGTRVVQKLIEVIKTDIQLDAFINSFQSVILDLFQDVNGNHIVIKFVTIIKAPMNNVLYNSMFQNILEIATNKHACCALQKCIDFANDQQRKNLIDILVSNTLILLTDQYGNYVLQYIISLNNHAVNYHIACYFKNNITYLSKQKFSSNVIEKCFDYCDEKTKVMIINEVACPRIIVDLLLDMYGNYGK